MMILSSYWTGRPRACAIVAEGNALGISSSSNHRALSGRSHRTFPSSHRRRRHFAVRLFAVFSYLRWKQLLLIRAKVTQNHQAFPRHPPEYQAFPTLLWGRSQALPRLFLGLFQVFPGYSKPRQAILRKKRLFIFYDPRLETHIARQFPPLWGEGESSHGWHAILYPVSSTFQDCFA
jgi:hypothetical protein